MNDGIHLIQSFPVIVQIQCLPIINRPGLAGAVLQSPLSINSFIH